MTSALEIALKKLNKPKELTPEERNLYLRASLDLKRSATAHIKIAVVTALSKERAAMAAMLDELEDWPFPGTTHLQCEIGKVRSLINDRVHHILLTQVLEMGNNSAAVTATQLISDFPNITDILMVGIAGAIPNPTFPEKHVRLGDIVVSKGLGVIQYDLVKLESAGKSTRRGHAPAPSARLQAAVDMLDARRIRGERPWELHLGRVHSLKIFARPSEDHDVLYANGGVRVPHPVDPDRQPNKPQIHYGTIGSANILLRDPGVRDALRDDLGIIAVEMEGSGIADASWAYGIGGYLLIRGACDYCDKYKNDLWQGYAAAVAAAYARALIEVLPGP